MTDKTRKWLLFACWPLVAIIVLTGVLFFVVVAWAFIPFGQMVRIENGEWALRFPWTDSGEKGESAALDGRAKP